MEIIGELPIGIVIVYALAFIYNLNHNGVLEAIRVTTFSIIGVICFCLLLLYVIASVAWEEKLHIITEWIMDRIQQ